MGLRTYATHSELRQLEEALNDKALHLCQSSLVPALRGNNERGLVLRGFRCPSDLYLVLILKPTDLLLNGEVSGVCSAIARTYRGNLWFEIPTIGDVPVEALEFNLRAIRRFPIRYEN
jgi:hypothetical protein